jgi:hypothetical protein
VKPARIAAIPARAGIESRHQHEIGGKPRRRAGAADCDGAVFERLPEHFERAAIELGKLVQK